MPPLPFTFVEGLWLPENLPLKYVDASVRRLERAHDERSEIQLSRADQVQGRLRVDAFENPDAFIVTTREFKMDCPYLEVGRSGRCHTLLGDPPSAIDQLVLHTRPRKWPSAASTQRASR